jgi:hypothetical protein
MKPRYIFRGHPAGVAAKLAIAESTPVQTISAESLVKSLKERGAIMECPATCAPLFDPYSGRVWRCVAPLSTTPELQPGTLHV